MLGKRKSQDKPVFTPPDQRLKYPKWSIVYAQDSSKYYLVLDKSKMEFISDRAVRSWGRPFLVGTEKTLSGYSRWHNVGFAPGTLLTGMDGVMYYVSGKSPIDTVRLKITTPDVFEKLGFSKEFSFTVSDKELEFHMDGGAIENVSL